MKKLFYVGCFSSFILISGCALYQKPEVPALEIPKNFKTDINKTNAKLKGEWWENFHNEKLNTLVDLAVKNNYNYQISIKNIQIASTYVSQNLSSLFPQISLNASSSRNKSASVISNLSNASSTVNPTSPSFSSIFNLNQLTGSVSYEVDIWNQVRNSVKQAKADEAASIAASKVVRLTLIASVVDTYFQIITTENNLINLKQQYQCAIEIVNLFNTQFRSGLIDASTLYTAKNQMEIIKSNILVLEKQREILRYTMAYLVGEYPENFKLALDQKSKKLETKKLIPAGIPAEMLANRPDIQGAYYQVLSAGYVEKQNIANFLPAVNLTGNYGYASTALSGLISGSNAYWNYGIFATQFVFDYQARMSIFKRSKYQFESAILTYKNTVLNAFIEVDSALISYKEDNEALLSYQRQMGNAVELFSISNSQYQAGLVDYSTSLAARLNYLQSSYNLNNQKLVVIEDVVQVYKSLGLGL